MASEWRPTTVGAVSLVVTKGTTPTTLGHAFQDSGVNFVKVESISSDGRFIHDKLVHISTEAHEALARSKLAADDVLFTIAGTIGRTAIVSGDILPANTNQAVAIVRPNLSEVTPRYLRHLLANPAFLKGALSRTVESVQANFSLGELKSAPVLLPSLDEQKAIADVLGALDDRIDLLRQTNTTLESIAQALFKSWFIDFDPVRAKAEGREPEGMDAATAALFPAEFEESALGLVPRGWKVSTVGQETTTVDYVANGSFAALKANVSLHAEPDYALYVRTTDHNSGFVGDFRYVSKAAYDFLSKSSLDKDDVVISNVGDVGTVFRPPSWLGFPMTLGSNAVAVKGSFPNYLFFHFKGPKGQHQISSIVTGSAQLKFNKTNFRSLPLLVPEWQVLSTFEEATSPLLARIDSNMGAINSLSALRDTLLPRLISGKLRLPEAEAHVEEAIA